MLNEIELIYWVVYGLVVALPLFVFFITRKLNEDITIFGLAILICVAIMPGVGFAISMLVIIAFFIRVTASSETVVFKGKK